MKYLDLSLPTPEENLACDEALLELCEQSGGHEVLRFWEPRNYFVVLGYANRAETEVNLAACAARNIPIFRRCSGGGTVLQGPGCLNYSLILKIDDAGPLHSITSTNRFVMQRHQDALRALVGSAVEVAGHTDLALDNLKFSGNAQRRHKKYLLFHGTFLVDFEIELMEKVLRFPSRQPDYRENRGHQNFLCNLRIDRAAIRETVQNAWGAMECFEELPREHIAELVEKKYSRTESNHKF